MRGHVRALDRAETACAVGGVRGTGTDIRGALLSHGRHGVLEGTSGCEMLAVTDTALDLLVLQLVLHASGLSLLLLGIFAPVRARSEYDVLSDRGGI